MSFQSAMPDGVPVGGALGILAAIAVAVALIRNPTRPGIHDRLAACTQVVNG